MCAVSPLYSTTVGGARYYITTTAPPCGTVTHTQVVHAYTRMYMCVCVYAYTHMRASLPRQSQHALLPANPIITQTILTVHSQSHHVHSNKCSVQGLR